MWSWNIVDMHAKRYSEYLGQAEQDRLVRQALLARSGGQRFHRRALAWLGHRVVNREQWSEARSENASRPFGLAMRQVRR